MSDSIASVPAWKTRREIMGFSAILLPFESNGEVDWDGFRGHVSRTIDAGLYPAVNMDTGYGNLIDQATRVTVLEETKKLCGDRQFAAGAFVGDAPGAAFDADAYLLQVDAIQSHGGTPVFFQSYGLVEQDDADVVKAYQQLGAACDQFIGFELGSMFAPFGKIYSLDVYRELVKIPQCIGAKHSSLDRNLEWQRLAIRDAIRPDFRVFTGNDLAIDMVIYGSDYLLGLSTMAPDLFGKRDRMWAAGDTEFFHLNDLLQYLGFFSFRDPVPAYKHTAAQLLHLRGWIASNRTHPDSPTRPESDIEVLRTLIRSKDWKRFE